MDLRKHHHCAEHADYEREVADEHTRIMNEEGYCWHLQGGILDGYSECEAEVWCRHHPEQFNGSADAS